MTKCDVITHSSTKRTTASALAALKARRGWSNADMGDVMGCGEGTVRHRMEADDTGHQMTVHELKRVTQADGPTVGNAILADIGFSIVPDQHDSAVDALAAAGGSARCAAALIEAAPGGIDRAEARRLLPLLEAHGAETNAMLAECRRVMTGGN